MQLQAAFLITVLLSLSIFNQFFFVSYLHSSRFIAAVFRVKPDGKLSGIQLFANVSDRLFPITEVRDFYFSQLTQQ